MWRTALIQRAKQIIKNIPLSTYLENVGQVAYGCMGLGGGWNDNPVTAADVAQNAA